MNTDGCPALWATDEILIFGEPSAKCAMSVPIWLVFTIVATVCRTYLTLGHWQFWFARERRMAADAQTGGGRRQQRGYGKRLPIVPVLSTTVSVSQWLLVTLTSTNTISSRDGSSAVMATFLFTAQHAVTYMYALKLIRLGRKICPVKAHDQQPHGWHEGNLARFDWLQRLLLVTWTVSFFGNFIAPFFTLLSEPLTAKEDAFRAQFIFCVFVDGTSTAIQLHQFTRVIRAIKVQSKAAHELAVQKNELPSGGTPSAAAVSMALRRLEAQRFFFFLAALPILAIVTSIAITANVFWWLFILVMYVELFVIWITSKTMGPKKPRGKASKSKDSATVGVPDGGDRANDNEGTMAWASVGETSKRQSQQALEGGGLAVASPTAVVSSGAENNNEDNRSLS